MNNCVTVKEADGDDAFAYATTLKSYITNTSWNDIPGAYYYGFFFADESDVIMFKLRFGI